MSIQQESLWRPPTKELVYISVGLTEEELDRFVDLCCHYDNGPIVLWDHFRFEDHGLAGLGLIDIVEYASPVLGLIDIVEYASPVTLRITGHGKEIFEDLKRYDPVSLINSCIRLGKWGTAAYFVWARLSASQLPEFLAHDRKEIRDMASMRMDILA